MLTTKAVKENCQYRKQQENQGYLRAPTGITTPNTFQTSCPIARVNVQFVLAAFFPPLWPGCLQAFGIDQYWPRCARCLAQISISLFCISGVQNNPSLANISLNDETNDCLDHCCNCSETQGWPCLEIPHNLQILALSNKNKSI